MNHHVCGIRIWGKRGWDVCPNPVVGVLRPMLSETQGCEPVPVGCRTRMCAEHLAFYGELQAKRVAAKAVTA